MGTGNETLLAFVGDAYGRKGNDIYVRVIRQTLPSCVCW